MIAYQEPEAFRRFLQQEQWLKCQRCRLCNTRSGDPIVGEGNWRSKIVFVGEAPWIDEEQQGRPFVGRSGQLLEDVLYVLGVERETVWFTNAVACRPADFDNHAKNRAPSEEEIKACKPRLLEELYCIDPDLIVALGAVPTKVIGGPQCHWSQFLGEVVDVRIPARRNVIVKPMLVTHHPAGVLRKTHSNEYLKDLPKEAQDFIRVATSKDPLHQFVWHMLLAIVGVLYARAIQEGKGDIPDLVKEVANLMP